MIGKSSMNKPVPKPRHSLSEINSKKMTATCAVCGQTDILKRKVNRYTVYICATKKRNYADKYRLLHSRPRTYSPTSHVLSEVDDEKKTAVCSQCGPVKIYISRHNNSISRRCSKANMLQVMQAQKKRRKANKQGEPDRMY
jgi:hypothetical protein